MKEKRKNAPMPPIMVLFISTIFLIVGLIIGAEGVKRFMQEQAYHINGVPVDVTVTGCDTALVNRQPSPEITFTYSTAQESYDGIYHILRPSVGCDDFSTGTILAAQTIAGNPTLIRLTDPRTEPDDWTMRPPVDIIAMAVFSLYVMVTSLTSIFRICANMLSKT